MGERTGRGRLVVLRERTGGTIRAAHASERRGSWGSIAAGEGVGLRSAKLWCLTETTSRAKGVGLRSTELWWLTETAGRSKGVGLLAESRCLAKSTACSRAEGCRLSEPTSTRPKSGWLSEGAGLLTKCRRLTEAAAVAGSTEWTLTECRGLTKGGRL